ncbi:MAG TPA: hypothetical protein VLL27_14810 [Solirubrobacterales bacterium]|nr:hypothetical protein [Solirubrobacterales bacterium]
MDLRRNAGAKCRRTADASGATRGAARIGGERRRRHRRRRKTGPLRLHAEPLEHAERPGPGRLNNQGEDPHNLNLQRQGSGSEPVYELPNALPGKQESASFDLPPGTYRLWCSLLEHDAEGMHATLVVE